MKSVTGLLMTALLVAAAVGCSDKQDDAAKTAGMVSIADKDKAVAAAQTAAKADAKAEYEKLLEAEKRAAIAEAKLAAHPVVVQATPVP